MLFTIIATLLLAPDQSTALALLPHLITCLRCLRSVNASTLLPPLQLEIETVFDREGLVPFEKLTALLAQQQGEGCKLFDPQFVFLLRCLCLDMNCNYLLILIPVLMHRQSLLPLC